MTFHEIYAPGENFRNSTTAMPPKSAQNTQKLVEQEGRLQLAISALKKNQISNITKAAKIFNILYSTLCN
jgi:hypothetical protein